MLPAASGELLVESTESEYESGEIISVRVELTGSTRANTKVIDVLGLFPEEGRTPLSGFQRDLDSDESEYYFNWTVAVYAKDGTYYGPIDINVTAYKSDNLNASNIVAREVVVVTIVEPAPGAGLDLDLPVDPMLVGVVLIALVVFVGGGFFVYRFFSDREVILPGDSPGLPGLGGPGGLAALGGKTEERREPGKAAARPPAGKARPPAGKARPKAAKGRERGREKRKPSSRRKPTAKPGPRSKPRRPARPKARRPPSRSPPRPPRAAPPPPSPRAPPRPGGPPKPRAQSFHCPTDGNELRHWPDSGYKTDYFCSKCELYVTPREQGGGASGDSQAPEVKEVTCPGCHTVHEITDPTVKRITCTCGRRIRVNLD